jgi:FMN phosphatase YigB (HAD superfamily)
VITNGTTDIQTAKLEELGIRDAFDTVVICNPEADIPSKPNPEPFALALTEFDGTPETTAHVGDSYDCDVGGAHNAGLQSIWVPPSGSQEDYSNHSEPGPTYRLDSMNELSDVL